MASYAKNVNTFTDYGAEQQEIDRRRKMAELLAQQSMQPIEVPTNAPVSWTQGLAKLLQGYGAGREEKMLGERQKELGQRYTSDRSAALANALKAGEGTPASPYDATEFGGDTGMNPATPPDRMATYRALAGSQFPDLQTMGMAELLKKPENPFAKIDPKDYTQDSIRQFAATQNPAVLVPVRKMEAVSGIAGPNGPQTQFVNPYEPPQQPLPQAVQSQIAPSGVVYNPYQAKPGDVFNDPNKLMNIGADGRPVVNEPLVGARSRVASAGAPKINVNTEKQFLGQISETLGKDIATATQQAKAAVGTLNTVGQIHQALDSGNVIAGPATSARVFLGQIGQVLGVAGKDATEQLTKTREVIQGMAQLELDAAQQMKGQGQITEAERMIIKRAASGDIDGMSIQEIRTLTNALDKVARYKIQSNARNVENLAKNPNAASMVEFMRVQEPPPYQPASQSVSNPISPSSSAPTRVRTYNPATGRLE